MKLLFEHFELLADAPNSVPKLRELILQLAVQGKLVPQDPNDEPASELLKRIQAEKERLIAEGKIKKEKPLPPVSEKESPYQLPEGWVWCRLGYLCEIITKGSSPRWQGINYVDKKGLLFITSKNVGSYKLITDNFSFVEWRFNAIEPRSILKKGDILMNLVGASIGRTAIYELEQIANINQAVSLIRLIENVPLHKTYLLHFFNSPISIDFMFKNQVESARANLSLTNVNRFLIPLPPVLEQKRIVAKVEQLMALCDELEQKQAQRSQKRIRLNNAALNKLLTASAPGEFGEHWQRIVTNFELLYDAPETVAQLKQAILQLAVQGKLIKQDPADEPAGELLRRIQTEKERLIVEGKIKKEKPLPPVSAEEIPYQLPEGWVWCRLIEIGEINPRNNADDELEVSFIPMALISENFGTQPQSEKQKWLEIKNGFTHFAENDVVVAKITPCFENGKAAIMRNLLNGIGAGTTELHVFRGNKSLILPEYVYIYFKSPKFRTDGVSGMTGTAGQKRVPKTYVAQNPFPLPPFSEQQRIVAKVEELLNLCNTLEEQLTRALQNSERLMSAVVQGVVGN